MTKSIRKSIALSVAMFVLAIAPRIAHAQQFEVEDPFGNASTEAIVGFFPSQGVTGALYRNLDDPSGTCFGVVLGDTTGLTADFLLLGLGGNDKMLVAASQFQHCGIPVQPLNYNGFRLDMDGEDGNDTLTSFDGATFLYGGAGNDLLFTYLADATVRGGAGNDTVYSGANGGGSWLFGDGDHFTSGDDCMQVAPFSTPTVLSCGTGTDLYCGSGSRPGDCETTISWCCPGVIC
jgi:Ca2+-binding RTX toxin-like protein